jgi:hypothetical protein
MIIKLPLDYCSYLLMHPHLDYIVNHKLLTSNISTHNRYVHNHATDILIEIRSTLQLQ